VGIFPAVKFSVRFFSPSLFQRPPEKIRREFSRRENSRREFSRRSFSDRSEQTRRGFSRLEFSRRIFPIHRNFFVRKFPDGNFPGENFPDEFFPGVDNVQLSPGPKSGIGKRPKFARFPVPDLGLEDACNKLAGNFPVGKIFGRIFLLGIFQARIFLSKVEFGLMPQASRP